MRTVDDGRQPEEEAEHDGDEHVHVALQVRVDEHGQGLQL
jgi:hypothetical protein